MDLMKLLENWKQIAGMNQPMLPGQPSQATPPFMPAPGQGGYQPQQASSPFGSKTPQPGEQGYQPQQAGSPFGTKSPLQPIQTPQRAGAFPEVTAPDREKVGIDQILPEVQTPDRKPIYANNDLWQMKNMDKKWYKDGDFMNELGGRLSNAFGAMTLRGNTPGEEKANMLKIAQAGSNRKKNKTMDALIQSNPELASKLMDIPEESREKYMDLAMRQSFGDIGTDAQDPAAVATYKFFNGLDKNEQREFMNLKRAGNVITRPDGSVLYRNADGSWQEAVSSKEALEGAANLGSAETSSTVLTNKFVEADASAKAAYDQLPGLREELAMADKPRAEGFFAPIERWKAEIADELGIDSGEATTNQLLKAGATRRVMDWFKTSGLGARGMDTPAEFARFLEGIAGSEKMTNEAYKAMLERLIRDKERAITDFNGMIDDDKYSFIYGRDSYSPYELVSADPSANIPLPPGAVLD